ncbi:hypothetical protein [Planctobacterium marinum]|uniref:hypothetical protein n=1 Tax=Planctobacterium marinum TaxID=1631968 RepID=UPI001E50D044|nr:hypothetical protein [Planctobacterium marinum]MCC2604067.1 hypothetical protein [Planctobacterium marinum]
MEHQHKERQKLKITLDSEFQRTRQKALAQKKEELQKLINAQSESEIKRLGDDSPPLSMPIIVGALASRPIDKFC